MDDNLIMALLLIMLILMTIKSNPPLLVASLEGG